MGPSPSNDALTFCPHGDQSTGGSTGLGRGIAVKYAEEGAKVAILDLVERAAKDNFDEKAELPTAEFIKKVVLDPSST